MRIFPGFCFSLRSVLLLLVYQNFQNYVAKITVKSSKNFLIDHIGFRVNSIKKNFFLWNFWKNKGPAGYSDSCVEKQSVFLEKQAKTFFHFAETRRKGIQSFSDSLEKTKVFLQKNGKITFSLCGNKGVSGFGQKSYTKIQGSTFFTWNRYGSFYLRFLIFPDRFSLDPLEFKNGRIVNPRVYLLF